MNAAAIGPEELDLQMQVLWPISVDIGISSIDL